MFSITVQKMYIITDKSCLICFDNAKMCCDNNSTLNNQGYNLPCVIQRQIYNGNIIFYLLFLLLPPALISFELRETVMKGTMESAMHWQMLLLDSNRQILRSFSETTALIQSTIFLLSRPASLWPSE